MSYWDDIRTETLRGENLLKGKELGERQERWRRAIRHLSSLPLDELCEEFTRHGFPLRFAPSRREFVGENGVLSQFEAEEHEDGYVVALMNWAKKSLHEPKPRRGDYYADLSFDAWRSILFSEKHDTDITRLASLVFLERAGSPPRQGWCDTRRAALIGDARAFGALKYSDARDSWRAVPLDDHLQSAGRHLDALLEDPKRTDPESGLLHEAHFLARAVRILELRRVTA
jgi:hypothetical protein